MWVGRVGLVCARIRLCVCAFDPGWFNVFGSVWVWLVCVYLVWFGVASFGSVCSVWFGLVWLGLVLVVCVVCCGVVRFGVVVLVCARLFGCVLCV